MPLRIFCRLLLVACPHKTQLKDHASLKRTTNYTHLYPWGHRRPYSVVTSRGTEVNVLTGKQDRHNGIHVKLADLDASISLKEFGQRLEVSVRAWRATGNDAAWLWVPIERSALIPEAVRHGFRFHHAEGDFAALCCWLQEPHQNKIPPFASHQVGVAGCVVREDTREILMVQDNNRSYTLWKFPGGLAEIAEDISATAEREVYEETGIKADFQGIISFRQVHDIPNAFGRSDLFFLCHLKPRTLELNPDYENEIAKCQWMAVQEILDNPHTTMFTHNVCHLVNWGLDRGFRDVHFGKRRIKTPFAKAAFNMYCPAIIDEVTKDSQS